MCTSTYIIDLLSVTNAYILNRHWDRSSEPYTSADALFTALEDGWQAASIVFRETFYFSSGRQTQVYHFMLTRQGELTFMSILESPHILRFMNHENVQLQPLVQRAARQVAVNPSQAETAEVPVVVAAALAS